MYRSLKTWRPSVLPWSAVWGIGLILFLVLFSGCGGGSGVKIAVKGKLVKNGVPLKVAGQEVGAGYVEIRFIVPSSKAPPRMARVQPDGTFELDDELPAGKYRLAVFAMELPPISKSGPPPMGLVDQLQDAYSEENTPIEREIIPGADLGVIDLASFPTKKPSSKKSGAEKPDSE